MCVVGGECRDEGGRGIYITVCPVQTVGNGGGPENGGLVEWNEVVLAVEDMVMGICWDVWCPNSNKENCADHHE